MMLLVHIVGITILGYTEGAQMGRSGRLGAFKAVAKAIKNVGYLREG
jgi:hypothetical protein